MQPLQLLSTVEGGGKGCMWKVVVGNPQCVVVSTVLVTVEGGGGWWWWCPQYLSLVKVASPDATFTSVKYCGRWWWVIPSVW